MSENVSDFLVKRLSEWGVKRIFGYPGDGINGVFEAMNQADGLIDFIQVRHEEMAAFMACAHAKFTGEPGVCIATSGPGAIHLLNGLYDAKMDHQPVVAIVGQQARASLGGAYQQEVDLVSLFKDVAHEYVFQASVPAQIRHLIDRAMRIAIVERTVTCVVLPNDLQEEKAVEAPPHKHSTIHSGIGAPVPRVVPSVTDLQKAADLLNEGEKVAILIGAGARQAAGEVMQVAELLGAGVAKALLGKDVLPDDLPYVTGPIGLLGSMPSYEMMMDCDTLLMIGSSFPYPELLPEEGQAKGIQIDIDGKMLSIRYPMALNLIGDSAETLRELIPLLKQKENTAWRDKIKKNIEKWWGRLEERSTNKANPVNPQLVFHELSKRLPDNCILCADSGSVATWYARDLKIRSGMRASISGNLASMGCSVPYAIGAKFAHPDKVVFALAGDGAMQMNGSEELITVKKYWERWSNPGFIVVVLNNRDLNMVTWEQRIMTGEPKFEASQNLPDFPYAQYAESIGLMGIRIDAPEQVAEALDRALSANRPVLIEAVTDPNVPPMPPHVTMEQGKNFWEAVLKGDPNSKGIVRQSLKEMLENYWY
jgi:pyruvate dehydrogenase (quinone)